MTTKMHLVEKACKKAAEKHNTFRNDCGLPYIVHPIAVMVDMYNRGIRNEAILSAAVMHDLLEDTPYTEAEMEADFGKQTTDIVREVSKLGIDDQGITEKMRFLHTFAAKSVEGIMVKMSDRFDNINSYIKDGKRNWYPGYYACQAYPLLRAFESKKDEIVTKYSIDVYTMYERIMSVIVDLVSDQYYGLDLMDPKSDEQLDNILITRNRGKYQK